MSFILYSFFLSFRSITSWNSSFLQPSFQFFLSATIFPIPCVFLLSFFLASLHNFSSFIFLPFFFMFYLFIYHLHILKKPANINPCPHNFHSECPFRYKRTIMKTLISRAKLLSSSLTVFLNKLEIIKQTLIHVYHSHIHEYAKCTWDVHYIYT